MHVDSLGLGLVEFGVVALGQFLLEVENLVLESKLVDLVLGFQGQDLVVCVLAETLSIVRLLIELFDVVNGLLNFVVVAVVDPDLVSQLLTPDINLLSERLVPRLQIIELGVGFLAPVLQ